MYCGQIVFAVFLFFTNIILCFVDKTSASKNSSIYTRELLWQPNSDGLFSQFIQLKIMYLVAKRLDDRYLIVNPSTSIHFQTTVLNMCKIFELDRRVSCPDRSVFETSHCIKQQELKWKLSKKRSKKTTMHIAKQICYKDLMPLLDGETHRDAVLQAVNYREPQLKISRQYIPLIKSFKENIGVLSRVDFNQFNYSVVHWRRGDQLISRCQQEKDTSVNCKSAEELVALVRQHTSDELVYVATNEPSSSAELVVLKNAGFKLFSDARMNVSDTSLTGFILEISIMLNASTFLAWGVSEVNDVIEHERMLRGKSYCSAKEETPKYPTWCWWHAQMKAQNKTRLQNIPKLLHSINLTDMPAYEKEVSLVVPHHSQPPKISAKGAKSKDSNKNQNLMNVQQATVARQSGGKSSLAWMQAAVQASQAALANRTIVTAPIAGVPTATAPIAYGPTNTITDGVSDTVIAAKSTDPAYSSSSSSSISSSNKRLSGDSSNSGGSSPKRSKESGQNRLKNINYIHSKFHEEMHERIAKRPSES